jgi:hypothetical protein
MANLCKNGCNRDINNNFDGCGPNFSGKCCRYCISGGISHTYDCHKRAIKKYNPTVELIGIIFNSEDKFTNVQEQLKTGINSKDFLIIYNENFTQFQDKNYCSEGGGNGYLRKYRSDGVNCKAIIRDKIKAKVYGIPTGEHGLMIFDYDNKRILDSSIDQIVNSIINDKIKYVLWTINSLKLDGTIGLGIFSKHEVTTKYIAPYINEKIHFIFDNKFYYSTNNKDRVINHGIYKDLMLVL